MGQACPEVISFMIHKNLGLILEPAEGCAVKDTITVTLVGTAIGMFLFAMISPPGFRGIGRQAGCDRAGGGIRRTPKANNLPGAGVNSPYRFDLRPAFSSSGLSSR